MTVNPDASSQVCCTVLSDQNKLPGPTVLSVVLQEYFSTMPWLAVPFKDDQLRSVLSRKFNVGLTPKLQHAVTRP